MLHGLYWTSIRIIIDSKKGVSRMENTVMNRAELMDMIAQLLKKYNASGALLFGSYARGEAEPDSDIDVMVIGGKSFRLMDVFAIAEELHEMTGKAVDVYELTEINRDSEFYHSIMREGVTVA